MHTVKIGVVERQKAIERGLEAIYRFSCEPQNFAEYGSDLLWCFYLISSTSQNCRLRDTARQMGKERARQWRQDCRSLPPNANAETVMDYLYGSAAAGKLGFSCKSLDQQIRQSMARFPVAEYLCFDPTKEPPPCDVTEQCGCGLQNKRGRKTCRKCRRQLVRMNRYEVCFYALTRSYSYECFGLSLEAGYADVIKWLPTMRPYRGIEHGSNPEFYDTVYFVTHVVYTLNSYGAYRLSSKWLPQEFEFLKANLKEAIATNDPEMVGEFLDSLKAFGLPNSHPLISGGMEYLLSKQNSNGSWGDLTAEDKYLQYHPTWTAIDGLRDYAWRGERLSFPKLKPLLTALASQKHRRLC